MTNRTQWLVLGGVLAGLAVFLAVGLLAFRAESSPVDVGAQAPPFTAHELSSSATKSLADYKGQVVLLNIWGTWCAPCREEMPSIERLHRALGAKGLKVVAVSIDTEVGDSVITAFARELGLSFQILHDSTMAITRQYLTTGYPETFVIDTTGRIRKKFMGPEDWDSPGNRALISMLLGLPPDAGNTPVTGDTARAAGLTKR